MKEEKATRLKFTYAGKVYTVGVSSICYPEQLVISKLKIGNLRYWLVLQNATWRFIGDMPLCREIKTILVRKMSEWHQLPFEMANAAIADQETVRKGILMNAILCVMTIKKQMPL